MLHVTNALVALLPSLPPLRLSSPVPVARAGVQMLSLTEDVPMRPQRNQGAPMLQPHVGRRSALASHTPASTMVNWRILSVREVRERFPHTYPGGLC